MHISVVFAPKRCLGGVSYSGGGVILCFADTRKCDPLVILYNRVLLLSESC